MIDLLEHDAADRVALDRIAAGAPVAFVGELGGALAGMGELQQGDELRATRVCRHGVPSSKRAWRLAGGAARDGDHPRASSRGPWQDAANPNPGVPVMSVNPIPDGYHTVTPYL